MGHDQGPFRSQGLLMFRGRRGERAALDRLLQAARAGRSSALVVRGEAGVGKTALLERAIESAADLTVLPAVGIESERELAFAALHQLCAPMLQRLDRLPEPQRRALETTFGLRQGPVPDRLFVGLAVLTLLSEVAQNRPILCVVDDAQWLDRASAQTLGFVARRLLAESVVMLFGARETGEDLRGLPELIVGGLGEVDARELLSSVIPWPLDEHVRSQIVAEAQGNPLALLELPRGLTPTQLAGGFALPGALSLVTRLQKSFLSRLGTLPEDTQRLLLAAAAEPTGDLALLWRTAAQLSIAPQALEPAQSAGLLDVGARLRFRHPLVRSAVYGAGSPDQRRQVHRALAEAIDPEVDPDRRAWHLAEATAGTDENAATELEQSAGRARARGGLAAAASFLERAVALTPEPAHRAQRALAAAQTKLQAGAIEDALELLAVGEGEPLAELGRAQVDLLRAQIAYAQSRGSDAPPLLLRAARQLEALDPMLARATYRDALTAASWTGNSDGGDGIVNIAQAILAAPAPEQPSPVDLLLAGVATQCTKGFAEGVPVLQRALTAVRSGEISDAEQLEWSVLTYRAAVDLWDADTWYVMASRYIELARASGAIPMLQFALNARIVADGFAGELADGYTRLAELQTVSDVMGSELPPYSPFALAAWRGDGSELSRLIEETTEDALARGETLAISAAQWAVALLYNSLGRFGEALPAARQAVDYGHLGFSDWSLAELIFAAVRSGELARAQEAHHRLSAKAYNCGSDWALGIEARCRALLTEGEAADDVYREAIERLGRTQLRAELARTHLLYGEWLRGQGRRPEAGEQLRTAHEMFATMGAEAFARHAERELTAAGERVRRRGAVTHRQLTAQEAHIARLARDGLSNADIGARLFVSPRTVEYHLHKVFDKLGIRSRTQLSRALPVSHQRPCLTERLT